MVQYRTSQKNILFHSKRGIIISKLPQKTRAFLCSVWHKLKISGSYPGISGHHEVSEFILEPLTAWKIKWVII